MCVQVNAQAAARIIAEQAGVDLEEGGKKKRKAGDTALPSLLDDNRFKVSLPRLPGAGGSARGTWFLAD